MHEAAGFIETRNWSALMAASDAMNKAAEVESLGEMESGGGYVSTMVGGEVGAVRAAVAAGSAVAKANGTFISENVIASLNPVVWDRFIYHKPLPQPVPSTMALGLIETMGFVAMVQAADAATDAARVELAGLFIPGGGYHALIIRGEVDAVRSAVQAGSEEAQRVNKVITQHVIPRPHVSLQSLFYSGTAVEQSPSSGEGNARGYIETKGYTPIVEAADAALKAAPVEALGWQKVGGGLVSIILGGEVGAVNTAVETGAARAESVGELITSWVLPGPHAAVNEIIQRPEKKK